MELKIKLHAANIRQADLAELGDYARLSSIAVYLSNLRAVNAMMTLLQCFWRNNRVAEVVTITTSSPYQSNQKKEMKILAGPRGHRLKSRVELATRAD